MFFFIIGITDGRKDLAYNRQIICDACGRYGRYDVFMTFTALSLFFIPVFKWNKQFFVRTSCCGALFELDPDLGKRIARGEDVEIQSIHLRRTQSNGYYTQDVKTCSHCGYQTTEDFDFCPKCGERL